MRGLLLIFSFLLFGGSVQAASFVEREQQNHNLQYVSALSLVEALLAQPLDANKDLARLTVVIRSTQDEHFREVAELLVQRAISHLLSTQDLTHTQVDLTIMATSYLSWFGSPEERSLLIELKRAIDPFCLTEYDLYKGMCLELVNAIRNMNGAHRHQVKMKTMTANTRILFPAALLNEIFFRGDVEQRPLHEVPDAPEREAFIRSLLQRFTVAVNEISHDLRDFDQLRALPPYHEIVQAVAIKFSHYVEDLYKKKSLTPAQSDLMMALLDYYKKYGSQSEKANFSIGLNTAFEMRDRNAESTELYHKVYEVSEAANARPPRSHLFVKSDVVEDTLLNEILPELIQAPKLWNNASTWGEHAAARYSNSLVTAVKRSENRNNQLSSSQQRMLSDIMSAYADRGLPPATDGAITAENYREVVDVLSRSQTPFGFFARTAFISGLRPTEIAKHPTLYSAILKQFRDNYAMERAVLEGYFKMEENSCVGFFVQ